MNQDCADRRSQSRWPAARRDWRLAETPLESRQEREPESQRVAVVGTLAAPERAESLTELLFAPVEPLRRSMRSSYPRSAMRSANVSVNRSRASCTVSASGFERVCLNSQYAPTHSSDRDWSVARRRSSFLWEPLVVGIQEGDVLTGRVVDARVARGAAAPIVLVPETGDPRAADSVKHGLCVVCRGVVADDLSDFSAHGCGVAPAAVDWLCDRLEQRAPLKTEIHDENHASKRLFERCGFQKRDCDRAWVRYLYQP